MIRNLFRLQVGFFVCPHEFQHLFPVLQGRPGACRRSTDRTAGIGKAQGFLSAGAPEDFRNKACREVIPGARGVHRVNRTGRYPESHFFVFQDASFAPQLDDNVFHPIAEENLRHFPRIVLSRKMPGLVLIGRDIVDQRQGFPDVLQGQEAEIRQLGKTVIVLPKPKEAGQPRWACRPGGASQAKKDQ